MVDDIVDRLGRIDILVNDAGVAQTKPMLDVTEMDWDRVLDVNLRGTFFVVLAVADRERSTPLHGWVRGLAEALRGPRTPHATFRAGNS